MAYVYRLWFVLLVIYLVAVATMNRDAILRVEPHDFSAGWEYGLNHNLYCAFPKLFVCKSEGFLMFELQRNRLLEEDFRLIVVFGALPVSSLLVLLIAQKAFLIALFVVACTVAGCIILLNGG